MLDMALTHWDVIPTTASIGMKIYRIQKFVAGPGKMFLFHWRAFWLYYIFFNFFRPWYFNFLTYYKESKPKMVASEEFLKISETIQPHFVDKKNWEKKSFIDFFQLIKPSNGEQD